MKQILQSLKDGSTQLVDIPTPKVQSGHLLIRTSASLLSAGTERMLIAFGKASLLEKARQQPDKVAAVVAKMRTDGIGATVTAIKGKLDQPLALGYCNAGEVIEVGSGVSDFAVGDRVLSNGKHAEFVVIPKNLAVRIPERVSDEHAVFGVLGAIGLQGIRLANPSLGECVVVIGLGLIGLLTVQMLIAQGCRVLAIDPNQERTSLARAFGAEVTSSSASADILSTAKLFSRDRGVDAVFIAASSKSSEPMSLAAKMSRKRGRIVLIGVTGLELSRSDFYEKELTFQVSCSYGPGRYDPNYEERGQDYPIGFVRWTEQRNFEAVLDLIDTDAIDVSQLISHRFPLSAALAAYELLDSDQPSLGIVLHYPNHRDVANSNLTDNVLKIGDEVSNSANLRVAFIGAGNYAGRVLIPTFKRTKAILHSIVSRSGVSAVHFGKKYAFSYAMTADEFVYENPEIDGVVISTRHNMHAKQVLSALRANKHVFCEKPLCVNLEELAEIRIESEKRPTQLLMVGFNRRFAPQILKMKELLNQLDEPKNLIMTINAGDIPRDHWTQSKHEGGGRLIGEACHFIDLLRFLVDSPIRRHSVVALGRGSRQSLADDNVTITLEFDDGSVGNVLYLANGNRSFPKERLEVFCSGRVLQLDNFRKLKGWGWGSFKKMNLWRQDKGQIACVSAFVDALTQTSKAPIPREELFEVSSVTIEIALSIGG